MHVLPLTWHLLQVQTQNGGGGNAAVKAATKSLVVVLYGQMGDTLLEQASTNSKVNPTMKTLLNSFID